MHTFRLGEQAFTIRQARPEEAPEILALMVALAKWIQQTGSIQWSHYLQASDDQVQAIAEEAGRGELYVVHAGERLAGAFSLLPTPTQWDLLLWGEEDCEAAYLHRLAVDRAFAGLGLGLQLLDWVLLRTRALGKEYLRLDCVAWVPALHRFYEQRMEYCGPAEYYNIQFKKWEKRVI